MTRSQSRELAFILLFEHTFTDEPMAQVIEQAEEAGTELDAFSRRLACGAAAHQGEIDELVTSCSRNWKLSRISRVAVSALRECIYEILFETDIPASVSINEAIELTKKYAGPEDASFVNGVLGSIARSSAAVDGDVAQETDGQQEEPDPGPAALGLEESNK